MSEPLRTTCPHCRATFRITDAGLVGRPTNCPRCKKTFVVQAREAKAETPAASPSSPIEPACAAEGGSRLGRWVWRLSVAMICLTAGVLTTYRLSQRRATPEDVAVENVVQEEMPPPPDDARSQGANGASGTGNDAPIVCFTNLIPLQIAINKYREDVGRFPTNAIRDADGRPLLSWRVALLPYFESDEGARLHREFHLDEPWDSPHNAKLIPRMPNWFCCPRLHAGAGQANYLAVVGERSVITSERDGVRPADVTDSPEQTLMIVEVQDDAAVPWTKPVDWPYADPSARDTLGDSHDGGFHVLQADGFPSFVPKKPTLRTLHGLCTRDGGESADALPGKPAAAPE